MYTHAHIYLSLISTSKEQLWLLFFRISISVEHGRFKLVASQGEYYKAHRGRSVPAIKLVPSRARNENKDKHLTILSRESSRGTRDGSSKPWLTGTSAGCWMLGAGRSAGWYYSEPFVTRASRQPLSLLSLPRASPFSSPTRCLPEFL